MIAFKDEPDNDWIGAFTRALAGIVIAGLIVVIADILGCFS